MIGSIVAFVGVMALPLECRGSGNMNVEQSRDFAAGVKIKKHITDGFFAVDLKVAICDNGQFCSSKAATVVDRAKDQILANWLRANTSKPTSLVSTKRLTSMSKTVAQVFTPEPALPDAELDNWYETFCSAHAGQQVPLGTFITERKGTCQQRALLLKLLCDAAGITCTLVPGYDCNGGRHVWCEIIVDGTIKIFDPTWSVFGAKQHDLRYLSAEDRFGERLFQLREILPRVCEATIKQDMKSLIKADRDLLQFDKSIFGPDSLETSIDHHNLARALGQDRNYAEAIEHVERAWRIQARALGANNEHTQQSAALLQLLQSRLKP
jgi:hypothetical protein